TAATALQRGRRGDRPRQRVRAVHGASPDGIDRAHQPDARGGRPQSGSELVADVPARHPAAQPARPHLRVPAGLQRGDQRLRRADADGRRARARHRSPDLRSAAHLLPMAERRGDRRPVGRCHDLPCLRRAGADAPRRAPGAGRMTGRMPILLKPFVALTYLLLLAPLAIVVAVSFGASATYAFPPRELTLLWYRTFF